MNRLQRTAYGVLLAGLLALAACGKSNPLLGGWAFQAYQGGGQLGSVLGGLAAQFTRGTVVQFTPQAMIVVQGGDRNQVDVDHYDVEGRVVTVWIKTAADHMEGQTYRIADDGRSMSRELGTTGIREVFVRARQG